MNRVKQVGNITLGILILGLIGCGDSSSSVNELEEATPQGLEEESQDGSEAAETEEEIVPEDTLAPEEEGDIAAPEVVIEEGELPKGDTRFVEVNGVQREFRLQVPDTIPEGGRPILITVHGGGESDGTYPYPQESLFYNRSEDEGYIVAHPLALLVGDNEGAWQLNTTPDTTQDMEFMIAMLDDIEANFVVNPKRIYASGYSLGSMFTYEIACQMNNRVAAIATYAGSMPVSPTYCDMTNDIAIMHIHGFNDTIIPYSDSWNWKAWDSVGEMMSIPQLVEYWQNKHNCQDDSESESDSSVHQVYSSCDGDTRVEHHRLLGVGHEWPDNIEGVSTHQIVWEFVRDFSTP